MKIDDCENWPNDFGETYLSFLGTASGERDLDAYYADRTSPSADCRAWPDRCPAGKGPTASRVRTLIVRENTLQNEVMIKQ